MLDTSELTAAPNDKGEGSLETGPNSAGQSGDMQGISNVEDSNFESVGELLQEGQAQEASIIAGIEEVPVDFAEVDTTAEYVRNDLPESPRRHK